jgi:Flp pilus assembly protein TadG
MREQELKSAAAGEVSTMRTRNGEKGQSLVLVALSLVFLIGVLGLSVDVGYYRYVRREMQTAADAAALAGAMDVFYGSVTAAAKGAASENGFADGTGNVTVTVANPPTTGPYSGSGFPTYVQATVTQTNVPTFFSRIFGLHNITLSATSTAAGGTNCIYGLDTTGGAINVLASVVNSSCGVVDNDNLNLTIAALCAPSIQLKGNQTGFFGLACGGGFRAAKPVKITVAAPDPFAGLAQPAVLNPQPACTGSATSFTVPSNGYVVTPTPIYCGGIIIPNGRTGIIVQPGTYYGTGAPAFTITNSWVTFSAGNYNFVSETAGQPGIKLVGTIFGGNTVSFGAGRYTVYGGITDNGSFGSAVNWSNTANSSTLFIIDGGGLKLTGNSGTGGGSVGNSKGGVTFFNTGTAGVGAVTSYGTISSYFDFAGGFCGAKCQISAPTTGTYAGILYFNDPLNTATMTCGFGGTASACFNADSSIGAGTVAQAGAYYFPNGTVNFNFDFGTGAPYSFLVAKDINWFLSFTFLNDYSSLPNGSPVKQGSAILVQ